MAYALGLPAALRARGLKVEVVPGWETRSAGSFNPKGAVAHWTAGPRGTTGRPSLNVVVNGRPGLDGPLCNVYGARDGTAVVVAAGRANHAGTGSWRGLVGNSAVFGTEMEGADATDFTDPQRWAYPRIHAAYCDVGGFGPEMNCGHSEWAGPRKVDINGYTPDILRRDIAAVLTGDDMPTADEVAAAVWNRVIVGDSTSAFRAIQLLSERQVGYGYRTEDIQARVTALQAVIATLTADRADVTPEQIEAAVTKALRENTVKVAVDINGTAA